MRLTAIETLTNNKLEVTDVPHNVAGGTGFLSGQLSALSGP
jgi:hypothetical protein